MRGPPVSPPPRLGEPEGWTYDRRADMFVCWAEELAPDANYDGVAPAVTAAATRYLSRFPNLKLSEDPAVLTPLQEPLRAANPERLYQCERLSPAFDIVIVAAQYETAARNPPAAPS